MKKFCIAFSFLFLFATAQAQRNIDVVNYSYQLDLNDVDDTIYGRATITYILKKGNAVAEFDLFKGSVSEKGMSISNVTLPKTNFESTFKYSHNKNKVTISIPEKVSKDELFQAVIKYKGIPADGLIIDKNKYGHRTFFGDNWPN